MDAGSGADGEATPSRADRDPTPATADGGATLPSPLTRRAVLGGAASALAVGATGTATAQQSGMAQVPDYGGWFSGDGKGGETSSFDGTVDERGTDAVTIDVGASGNGGGFAFAPTAVWVDPGTTVTFEWSSNTHNVAVESQPDGAGWEGHEPIEDSGFSFEHTFETEGVYTYYCAPHLGMGMKGAVAVGDDVPTTVPQGAGPSFTVPGGDSGASFMGVLLGTAGLASALVLAGELHGSVTRNSDGPTSAHTTALAAIGLGLFVLAAVVVRLMVA